MKLICVLYIALHSVTSFAGGEVGNGGQQVALEFSTFGADVANQLSRNFQLGSDNCRSEIYSDLCNIDVDRLKNTIQLTRVISLPELKQIDPTSGYELTYVALNFPQDQRILVSENEWKSSTFCYVKKLPLVLHEYLGLMGIEIQNYRYSSVLAEWLIQTSTNDKFYGCPDLNNKNNGE